jgi:hypothetical protein
MKVLGLYLLCSLLPLSTLAHADPASVSMAWDYDGTGYTHFQVYRCTAATVNEDCAPLLTQALGSELPITQTTTTDTTGKDGERCCYTVRATLAGALPSVPSNLICTTLAVAVSGAPANLREIPSPTTPAAPSGKR